MNVRTVLRSALLVWGAVSLRGVAAAAAFVLYRVGPGNRARIDTASPRDVRFVLNWCRLGEQRINRVLHSHESARSLTGDHLDAYAIEISHVDLAELTAGANHAGPGWYRGDRLPHVLDDAVRFGGGWLLELPWFPAEAQIRSAEYYVYPWSIGYYGVSPTSAQLILVRPADRMVFYFSAKM